MSQPPPSVKFSPVQSTKRYVGLWVGALHSEAWLCLVLTICTKSRSYLQIDVPHPLEHPLICPDKGVDVLRLAASPPLLQNLHA